MPASGIVLVASPFTGPFVWSRVAPLLRDAGDRVEVHGVDGAIDGPVVLVAHSGGGPQLPAIAPARAGVAGAVFVDALLPHPGRSWAQTVPDAFVARLRAGAVDGKLAPWPEWWGEARLRELLPDDALRADFAHACPAVPVDWIDEVLPDAPALPSVFVQLSATYAPETEAARARGWPVLVVDADHLAPLTRPVDVAATIAEAIRLLTG